MKKILMLATSTWGLSSVFASSISENTIASYFIKNITSKNSNEYKKKESSLNYSDKNLRSSDPWTEYDLSKLAFKTKADTDHSLSEWNSDIPSTNDLFLNYGDITDLDQPSIQQDTYLYISEKLDEKLESVEESAFGTDDILTTEAKSELWQFNLSFNILGKSSNSTELIDNGMNTFTTIKNCKLGDSFTFYLRISNNSSTIWDQNKSYFDTTITIQDNPVLLDAINYSDTQNFNGTDSHGGWYSYAHESSINWIDYAPDWSTFCEWYPTLALNDDPVTLKMADGKTYSDSTADTIKMAYGTESDTENNVIRKYQDFYDVDLNTTTFDVSDDYRKFICNQAGAIELAFYHDDTHIYFAWAMQEDSHASRTSVSAIIDFSTIEFKK